MSIRVSPDGWSAMRRVVMERANLKFAQDLLYKARCSHVSEDGIRGYEMYVKGFLTQVHRTQEALAKELRMWY